MIIFRIYVLRAIGYKSRISKVYQADNLNTSQQHIIIVIYPEQNMKQQELLN